MKYKHFLIAATVETAGGFERLVDISHTRDNFHEIEGLVRPSVSWSLYGFKANGPSEWIGDYDSQASALEIYENLTGITPEPVSPDQLHIPLAGPGRMINIGYASALAEQIEQMKGMFDDEDGAIETALEGFYEEERRILAEES